MSKWIGLAAFVIAAVAGYVALDRFEGWARVGWALVAAAVVVVLTWVRRGARTAARRAGARAAGRSPD